MKTHKFLSTGGLGDAWIVCLKINSVLAEVGEEEFFVDWLHVESHDKIKEACEEIFKSLNNDKFKFTFECDPNYESNVRAGKWKDRTALSTSINGKCSLHGDTPELKHPFALSLAARAFEEINYDIVIQVSGGAKNSRNWKFDPRTLAAILKQRGYSVALVGNDKRFENTVDVDNFVGKVGLLDTLSVVSKSRLFIGLSGFLNYYACSMRVPNIHLIESADHEKHYYHPEWKSLGIEYPSMQAVMQALKAYRITEDKRGPDWTTQRFTYEIKGAEVKSEEVDIDKKA